QAPDPAGDPGVDEVDAGLAEHLGVLLVIDVVRVAAVDDQVPGFKQAVKVIDRLLGGAARGDHDPHRTRRGQPVPQLCQGCDVPALGVVVVTDHVVSCAAQALRHVAAHLAQADHADLHRCLHLACFAGNPAPTLATRRGRLASGAATYQAGSAWAGSGR